MYQFDREEDIIDKFWQILQTNSMCVDHPTLMISFNGSCAMKKLANKSDSDKFQSKY